MLSWRQQRRRASAATWAEHRRAAVASTGVTVCSCCSCRLAQRLTQEWWPIDGLPWTDTQCSCNDADVRCMYRSMPFGCSHMHLFNVSGKSGSYFHTDSSWSTCSNACKTCPTPAPVIRPPEGPPAAHGIQHPADQWTRGADPSSVKRLCISSSALQCM